MLITLLRNLARRIYKPLILIGVTLLFFLYLYIDTSPKPIAPSDALNLSYSLQNRTLKSVEIYLLQKKYVLTQWESHLTGFVGIIVASDMAKIFRFPLSSDNIALIVCVTASITCFFHYLFIMINQSIFMFFPHIIAMTGALCKIKHYIHATRTLTKMDGIAINIFIALCFAVGVVRLLVGFNTLNDPVEIDQYKLKTEFFLMLLAILHYSNQHVSLISITVSTTLDASPFNAAQVTIVLQKGFHLLSKRKSVTGIQSHQWTPSQLQNPTATYNNFDSSINYFKINIPNLINTKIADQAAFDGKLQEIFDNVPTKGNARLFIKDILLAASIAFAKASAYGEDVPLYEYLLTISGYNKVIRPGIIVDVIGGGRETNFGFTCLSAEFPELSSFQSAINYSKKVFKYLENLSRQHVTTSLLTSASTLSSKPLSTAMSSKSPAVIASLSTPLTPNGCLLLNLSRPNEYFKAMQSAIADCVPAEQDFRLYLEANAQSLWNGQIFEIGRAKFSRHNLFDAYKKWIGLQYIENPYDDKTDCSTILHGCFIKPYRSIVLADVPVSIRMISTNLYDSITVSGYIQLIKNIRQKPKEVMITGCMFNDKETFMADFVCAVHPDKIRFGGVTRIEYDRLVDIENHHPFV